MKVYLFIFMVYLFIYMVYLFIYMVYLFIYGLPIYIQGLPIYIGLYMLILVYICLYWLIIGQLIYVFFNWFYQTWSCHRLGPCGSKSNNDCGKMTVVSILNFDIFEISGPFWPPGPGPWARPGPKAQIWTQNLSKKHEISLGLASNGPKWDFINMDPLIIYIKQPFWFDILLYGPTFKLF